MSTLTALSKSARQQKRRWPLFAGFVALMTVAGPFLVFQPDPEGHLLLGRAGQQRTGSGDQQAHRQSLRSVLPQPLQRSLETAQDCRPTALQMTSLRWIVVRREAYARRRLALRISDSQGRRLWI